ncbi:interleukin-6 receptor subunit beta-like [Arapaima gigas]
MACPRLHWPKTVLLPSPMTFVVCGCKRACCALYLREHENMLTFIERFRLQKKMKTDLLLTVLAVVFLKGETAKPHFSLQCYKKTTDAYDDFFCTWEPGIPVENSTLFYDVPGKPVIKLCTGKKLSCNVIREDLRTKTRTTLWVEANIGNTTYRSHNLSVVLDNQVKYDAPEIKTMSRSSRHLTLRWEKPKNEVNEVIHEFAFRKLGDDLWKTLLVMVIDSVNLIMTPHFTEEWAVTFLQNDCYEVRIRRRAKGLDTVIWSDWSNIKKVPVEIYSQPKVVWKVGELKDGSRLLTLKWEEPQKLASFGGVLYKLFISSGPCLKENYTYNLNTTQHRVNVTASAVNLKITAINNVGESPTTQITVPAQHLNTCSKSLDLTLKHKKFCIEWYNFSDGETRPASVNVIRGRNILHAISKMKKGMKNFVRYHYFIHIHRKTNALCPFYKKEGVPKSAPVNVTVLNTTNSSALLWWKPIPVSDQKGFLKHYVIFITTETKADIKKVSWLQTNYTIQSLSPGTKYTVHIAGETAVGFGPNTTVEIQMNLLPPPTKGRVRCCRSLRHQLNNCVFPRLKTKCLPDIPRPVIPETLSCSPESDKETYAVEEEVDVPVLLPCKQDKSSEPELQEKRTMLEVCESPSQEQEDSKSQSDCDTTDACSSALSPDYKRQTPNLPTLLEEVKFSHGPSCCEVTPPSYKNSLVFELKTENTEEGTEF